MISWGKKEQTDEFGAGSSNAPDADLVRAARRGDKRAFVEIVARHQAMVCGIALGILGDFGASEDAAQEAFLTAWRKIHDLREPEKLRSWLGQIARHAALGNLRRQRKHDPLDQASATADSAPAPDEATASEEEAALVRDSLSKLPETYRLPLVLYYRDGQSVRAVAEALGVSEDAVKQRLARGREMLREQMSGLVESVLGRTAPSAVFTMTIAAAIGALAAPAAVAGAVFTATSAAAGTTSTLSSHLLTAMSTTKTSIITAALVAAICVPVGYHVSTNRSHVVHSGPNTETNLGAGDTTPNLPPTFENSAIFAEWRKLHEVHGTSAESMPAIYDAIAALKNSFHRRSFRAALIAEWVQIDAAGGFAFFSGQRDATQRRQFFQEWLQRDAAAAVDALMASGPGWEQLARSSLAEIARKVPGRVAQIAEQLPAASNNYWETGVRDAFAIVAEKDLKSARTSAEALQGPNREQALGGIALAWAKTDLNAAIAWAKALPGEIDRDEIIRGALFGKAATDPASALDQLGLVPPGGKQGYFATTTGARVLKEAAAANYDATVAWIAAHPGRLGHEDMMGIANAVTDRLNADPIAFLNRHAADNTLLGIATAINSALLNEGAGQRTAIWEWVKSQPESEVTHELRQQVITTAGYQDPELAIRLAAELPKTKEGDEQIQTLANSLFNGGSMLHRFDKLFEQAPERMRQPLLESAFNYLREDTLSDPAAWVARLGKLPEASRVRGAESIARAWASQTPEETVGWINTLPSGDLRNSAVMATISSWAAKDTRGAGGWIATLTGEERDRGAGTLALAMIEKEPREAMNWIASITEDTARLQIIAQAARSIALQNPAQARQWLETAPISAEQKMNLQSSIDRTSPRISPQATSLP
jgi:RNA polymerase sigma factor (sigma-70 family)